MPEQNAFSRAGRVLLGGTVILLALNGCAAGAPGSSPAAAQQGPDAATGRSGAPGTSAAAANAAVAGNPEDPLGIGANQAKICAQQPPGGFSRFAILVHNTTGESFTIKDINLKSAQALSITSAQAAAANRAGHGNHGAAPAGDSASASASPPAAQSNSGHARHSSAAPSPGAGASAETPSEPGPAEGYEVKPGAHLDVIVDVAIDAGAEIGTAGNVEVRYSSIEDDFAVLNNVELDIRRGICS